MKQFKAKDRKIRTITFLGQTVDGPPSGQQAVLWLPKGTYDVIGEETITGYYLGEPTTRQCARLHNAEGHVYYVTLNQLPENILS